MLIIEPPDPRVQHRKLVKARQQRLGARRVWEHSFHFVRAYIMAGNGVIFSDGIEKDFLEFNSGTQAVIGSAERKGVLVE